MVDSLSRAAVQPGGASPATAARGNPPLTEAAIGEDDQYEERLALFAAQPMEWVDPQTGEIITGPACVLLSRAELERALLWHIHGKPDGGGGILGSGDVDWLRSGGYTVIPPR